MSMIEPLYRHYQQYPHVQTDTRALQPGDIFFALKGPNFNGNRFAKQALEQGASAVVVDEDPGFTDDRIFRVPDSLQALQDLALYHRQQFRIPFLAITGSNGKTTTKELIHAVLSRAFRTYTTQGNLNNHIGIPLTILRVKQDAELAVIEMGANHQKEIASYCRYTLPTHGIITNCGKAHLEGFGGVEGVRKGKGELYDHLRANGGTAFVMWDYDYLRDMSKGISNIVTYGTTDAQLTGTVTRSEPFLEVEFNGGISIPQVRTQLVGGYNLPNVLVAACVGKYFGVTEEKIREAIEAYSPSNSRSQLVIRGSNRVILDAYNANPSSMRLAVENFARQPDPDKVVFLGAMAELGTESLEEHRAIVELLQQSDWKEVVLVGGDFMNVNHPYRKFANSTEAAEWASGQHFTGCSFLIKGSRSARMEKVLESIH